MKIVCFGDSNTYGYDPSSSFGDRYDADTRWPGILAKELDCLVINAGENGREVPHRSTDMIAFNRLVEMEKPIDLLMIMLGTNDLLQGNDASSVMNRMEGFLQNASLPETKILLIGPPALKLGEWVPSQELIKASMDLNKSYQSLSKRLCMKFVNAGEWNPSLAFDGVHLTEEGHRTLANGLLQYLRTGE